MLIVKQLLKQLLCSAGRIFFYFRMLHAVWVWHLHYLETCFISLFQTQSAANQFEHLGDFCKHMFPLSSYFSSKNAQGHSTACNLGGCWGERQHWIIACMCWYCFTLPLYMHVVLKIKFWASGGKGLSAFLVVKCLSFIVEILWQINSCASASKPAAPLVILPLVSGTDESILLEKLGVCSLLEFTGIQVFFEVLLFSKFCLYCAAVLFWFLVFFLC